MTAKESSLKMLQTDLSFRDGTEEKGSGNVKFMTFEKTNVGRAVFIPVKHYETVLALHSQSQ